MTAGAGVVAQVVEVLAQAPPKTPTLDAVLTNLRNWLMGVLALLATVCWTVAGVRYIAAQGDISEIEKAKAAVRYGAWGYALAALAPLLVEILRSIVSA